MKKLITESNEKFKIRELVGTNRFGSEYKMIVVQGNSYEFNQVLKARKKSITKKYQGSYGGGKFAPKSLGKDTYYWTISSKFSREKIEGLVRPLMAELEEFYKVSLSIDDQFESLQQYDPSEGKTVDEDAPSQEEINVAKNGLKAFKEQILKLATSEELFEKLKLMSDIKQGGFGGNFSKLSPANLWLVNSQKPDATIVMNRNNWKKYFNRTINDGATKIVIYGGNKVSAGVKKNAEDEYLAKNNKTRDELSSSEEYDMRGSVMKANEKSNRAAGVKWQGGHVSYFDYSDTTQMEGTEDTITAEVEKIIDGRAQSEEDKQKLKDAGGLASVQPNSVQGDEINSIYNGLLTYIEDRNIQLANLSLINLKAKENPTAGEAKHLSWVTLSHILHKGDFDNAQPGFAQKFYAGNVGQTVGKAQAEMASWMFMHGMGIEFKPEQVNQSAIFFGEDITKQANNMGTVMKQVEGAVLHLKNFVEVSIEDSNLSEGEGGLEFRMPSRSEVANKFGFTDLLNAGGVQSPEGDIQELHERLIRKILKRL